ncbi:MAG: 7-carboxy-7-deazaguanine synthase [Saprospiraceae bacterium]|nr:7-carboxy-7-deazaguanine synthase [Saprospiraceae bacterium]
MSEKRYTVKEMYYTLQGEGGQAGRAAIFLRFTGCNLWTGREVDRPKAICQFCDTDFVGTDGENGGKYTADELSKKLESIWTIHNESVTRDAWVVCTGGEPALQLDAPLIEAIHRAGFKIAIETNGTIELPDGLDWICVSPKAGAELLVTSGTELKLVYPQIQFDPKSFTALDFEYFFLQPMDGPDIEKNIVATVEYVKQHPTWRLSLQTHKLIGIP